MKLVKKAAVAPKLLGDLSAVQPNADWDTFRRNKDRYKDTAAQIRHDQRGICAYCEIDLLDTASPGKMPDFRIEHFHPKNPHTPPPNWAIDWTNLLGTCHGGSQRDVCDPMRFTAPDLCCDVPKSDNDWTMDILNPLSDVPASPRYFTYSESSGVVDVDTNLCPAPSTLKVSETIIRLRLNASRLTRMRKEVINGLREQISNLLEAGQSIEDASKQVSVAMFSDEPLKEWPAFFTCVRWYLGEAAEDRLKEIGYA